MDDSKRLRSRSPMSSFRPSFRTLLVHKNYFLVFTTLLLLLILFTFTLPSLCALPAVPLSSPVTFDRSSSDAAKTLRAPSWTQATKLIIVAGHAVFRGSRWEPASLRDERNWYLEPYQSGMVDTFLTHIRRGVDSAALDPSSLLLFAGGATRPDVGPRTEGAGYWEAAEALDWFGARAAVRNRSHVEGFSRDSLENLLFSICRFRQLAGRYPVEIEVVSFEFKRARFEKVHRRALRFPSARFTFTGVDPPGAGGGMRGGFYAKERTDTLAPFSRDPYACKEKVLKEKRMRRNPSLAYHPYPGGCEEIAPLFTYCGHHVYPGPLPWDRREGFDDEIDEGKLP